MKKIFLIFLILGILAVAVSASFAGESLNKTSDLNKAFEQAKSQNKSVLIVFDQKDCHYCDEMKEKTLSNPNVISKLNKDYVTVILDVNEHSKIADKYKIFGTPTTVILDSNQKQIGKIEGSVDADKFLNELKGI